MENQEHDLHHNIKGRPLTRKAALLSSLYLGPVQYYSKLYACDVVIEDRGEHFEKQSFRNRMCIAAADGPLELTIPIVRDGRMRQPMREVRISDHGRWQHLHWTALVSAYENSPYFEYYADDFRPFYEKPFHYLVDFNAGLQQTVCDLLQISPKREVADHYIDIVPPDCVDYRTLIHPKRSWTEDPHFRPAPYYQVFQDRLGFLPNLSIVDLLFTMGPEARLILRASFCADKASQRT